MGKTDLWKVYADKNPSFKGDGNVTMSAAGLRKLFDQTWDHAHEQGVRNGRIIQKVAAVESSVDKLMKKFAT
jgi:hypothetical protein